MTIFFNETQFYARWTEPGGESSAHSAEERLPFGRGWSLHWTFIWSYHWETLLEEMGSMSHTYDVIIIGAGIMGCSTAFELSKRGVDVAVLEKSTIGTGSTGKSSAIIRQHYSNEVTARMALYSLGVFQNFSDTVAGECDFTQTGFLVLTAESDTAGLEENVSFQKKLGIETEILDRDEIQKRWPYIALGETNLAAYEPQSGYADPNLTLNGYVHAAREHGARIYQETPATGIRTAGGKVVGVDTPREKFDAPVVLNCGGPWGARIGRFAGVDLPINSCRVQAAFFRRPAAFAEPHPVVADFVHAVYWRPETGDLTLVGLIDPEEENYIVDPDAYNEKVDFDFVADAGERLVRRFPGLEQSESTGGFAALYAITPDWHPIIDQMIPGSGLSVCAGFSGHGFKLGPAVGLMTADMLRGEETPGMNRDLFRLSRYEEGKPVRGQYDYSIVG
jgi:sarcosine oxidase subunit beta